MGFPDAIKTCFQKYVVFEGRAIRSEYWYWYLFWVIITAIASVLDSAIFPGSTLSPLETVKSLALLLPSISVAVRRLHDVGRSGWWVLLPFTIIGLIPFFYWMIIKGNEGENEYGPSALPPSHEPS